MAQLTARLAVAAVVVLFRHASADEAVEESSTQSVPDLLECYEYVVVGAGSAGSVVASRLSANTSFNVLLLEAGLEETPDLLVPFNSPFAANVNNTWMYATVPQNNSCLSFPGQMAVLTLGKIMGGTSSINSMNFVRGSRHDFDKWEKEYNATGWNYSSVLENFKAIENFNQSIGSEEERKKYHGFNGETPVNYPRYNTSLSYAFLNACREACYSYVDYNGENHTGYSRVQSNTAYGIRWSANKCFLKSGQQNRTNLHISMNSTVTKIIFNKDNRATHVVFLKDGVERNVTIGNELILSAGAINTPKLLMVSGIGPKQDLEERNITPVADLPVGVGLMDHIIFLGLVVTTTNDLVGNTCSSGGNCIANGLLTIPGAFEALLFTTSGENSTGLPDYPDIELELTDLFPDPRIQQSPYVSNHTYEKYYMPMFNKTGFMSAVAMVQPKSRGTVKLNKTHPEAPPLIDLQFLSENEDVERIVNGTLKVMQLFNTNAMKKIGAEIWNGSYPNCENHTIWSPEYIACFVRQAAFPGQHVCCTCPMGDRNDSVVDSRLRVRNVTNVRVIDASVMPRIPAGNINAAVLMIGDKGAKMVLEDYNTRVRRA
ncbi:L-sorbose 1-dehydrogenase-like [Dermacentor silvarum]|uniref:L-sorbose 1-dehydrogenase-like n=1 Tax=Dermacentor silvarum TaxID=543639 RepID=UPI002100FF2E|nr:L-sorbose 1-dehydrogenase-like [Dermacentor silvarum]